MPNNLDEKGYLHGLVHDIAQRTAEISKSFVIKVWKCTLECSSTDEKICAMPVSDNVELVQGEERGGGFRVLRLQNVRRTDDDSNCGYRR